MPVLIVLSDYNFNRQTRTIIHVFDNVFGTVIATINSCRQCWGKKPNFIISRIQFSTNGYLNLSRVSQESYFCICSIFYFHCYIQEPFTDSVLTICPTATLKIKKKLAFDKNTVKFTLERLQFQSSYIRTIAQYCKWE